MDQQTDAERLSLGFIGGGVSSAVGQTHFAASQLDGRWALCAGAFSRDSETNCQTGQLWNVPKDRVYDDYRDLIEREKDCLDAVVVLTPTPYHTEVVEALLNANIPVICEKTLVSDLEDLERIKKAYKPNEHFLAVTLNYSGYPMVRELRHRIEKGEFGKIIKLQMEMPQETFIREIGFNGGRITPQEWRLTDGTIPTICLDLGVHLHHLATFLTGQEPETVTGEFLSYTPYENIVDDITVGLRYASGMSGTMWFSKAALGHRNGLRIRIYGTKGSAEWYQAESEELKIGYQNGARVWVDRGALTYVSQKPRYNRMKPGHPSGFIEAFANLYVDIADAYLAWRQTAKMANPYVYGLEHSETGLKTFQAARQSFENNGKWIQVNEV